MGEREMEDNLSSFHMLLKATDLDGAGLLSESPEAQTRSRELPMIFRDKTKAMHGQGVRLVLEKDLSATDVNRSKNQLSIPKGKIKARFLTDEEIQDLDLQDMTVALIEPGPGLQVRHGLKLRKDYKREDYFSYVLKEWNAVTHPTAPNRLTEGCHIRLWAFRVNGDLHFCLVKCEAASADVENMATRE